MKKFLSLLFFCLTISLISSSICRAGAMPDKLSKKALTEAKELYQYLISNNYTPQAACGILGNCDQESSFNHNIDYTSRGTYFGAFQFSSSQKDDCKKWCKKNNIDANTVLGQFMYIQSTQLKKGLKTYVKKSFDEFKAMDNVREATEWFCCGYERCINGQDACEFDTVVDSYKAKYGDKYQDLNLRKTYAEAFLKEFADIEPVKKDGSNLIVSEENKKSITIQNGQYFTENTLGVKVCLQEINLQDVLIDDATRDNLYGDSLSSLSDWENDIEMESENRGVIYIVRKLIVLLGILMVLWTLLIYVAFWFDRINNFIDISFLSILTFGKLRVSDTDDECTYGSKEGESIKTVNHRTILFICALSLLFNTLVLSGMFFNFIFHLVTTVTNWLNNNF